jgi:hypothetical protein
MTDGLRAKQRRLASKPMTTFSPTGNAARALERMLCVCEERGIPVLMVEAALCSHSRKALAPANESYAAYIESLLRKHPLARYDDARAALPDEAFRDHHHANAYGSDLLCRRLARNVLPAAFAAWRRELGGTDQIARLPSHLESTTQ